MALSSMTGFARGHGVSGNYHWSWELKSVNAKGLELRLRLPPGWDVVEAPVRMLAVEKLARGTIHGNLTVTREGVPPVARVNDAVLQAVLETLDKLSGRTKAAPPSLDGILALKGVIEIVEQTESEEERRAAEAAVIDGFSTVLASLTDMRRSEGKILDGVLKRRLDEIAALVARAEAAPGRRPQAIKARLAEQVAALIETSGRFDSDRLHQEAVLIAAKADIREELDRLSAHVAQARAMLSQGGAVGRRLDFLSQELHRESNTLCAKANDVELTNIGLALKTVVEQFREQVQNLE
ncbi:MAG TPA: YicC/YloC family endoribonuclease [Xanthobacteraceae bacterium]|nr:YicC/YloC family endoribonuclease [Xanthobacteraceae bacterium]